MKDPTRIRLGRIKPSLSAWVGTQRTHTSWSIETRLTLFVHSGRTQLIQTSSPRGSGWSSSSTQVDQVDSNRPSKQDLPSVLAMSLRSPVPVSKGLHFSHITYHVSMCHELSHESIFTNTAMSASHVFGHFVNKWAILTCHRQWRYKKQTCVKETANQVRLHYRWPFMQPSPLGSVWGPIRSRLTVSLSSFSSPTSNDPLGCRCGRNILVPILYSINVSF